MSKRAIKIFQRLILNYINYKFGQPRPIVCFYHITHRCNLSCRLCLNIQREKLYLSRSSPVNILYSPLTENKSTPFIKCLPKENEMNTEQAKYAIDQIEKLGVSIIFFTGGEPLLRKDLEELAQYARKKNMITNLFTNGTLITEDRVKSLKDCFDNISVSIYGLEKVDDEIKQREGSFKDIVRCLKLLKKYPGAGVGINFVINKYNHHQIEDFLNFAKENCNFIHFVPVESSSNEFFLDRDSALIIEKKLLKLKEKNKNFITNSIESISLFHEHLMGGRPLLKCTAYNISLFLGAAGEFGACCYPFAIGNILNQEPKKLLRMGLNKKGELQKKCRAVICILQPPKYFFQILINFLKSEFLKYIKIKNLFK